MLSFVAGFADATTFVQLSGLFAAHITGNLVLLAASLAQGADAANRLKFASFPGFLIAVYVAARLPRALGIATVWPILLAEAAILIAVGAIAFATGLQAGVTLINAVLGLTVVFALGLQNQAQSGLAAPPTTVMTGNVTRLVAGLSRRDRPDPQRTILLGEIGGFVGGCIVGAASVLWIGLGNFLFVGAALLVAIIRETSRADPAAA